MSNASPLMVQYRDIKSQYEDCVLLFRVGDFYETFYEDAVDVARILNIALTTRDKNKPNPIPLAGVPFHAAEAYVTKLLAAGRKVAICEQVEDASQAKGLVKRDVVEVLTPGTALNAQLLEAKENNYCLTLYSESGRGAAAGAADSGRTPNAGLGGGHDVGKPSGHDAGSRSGHGEREQVGVALLDVSTGEFTAAQVPADELQPLLQGKRIREVYIPKGRAPVWLPALRAVLGDPFIGELDAACFQTDRAQRALDEQGDNVGSVGERTEPLARIAAGALLEHARQLRGGSLSQVVDLAAIDEDAFLAMDDETIRNLELFEPLHGGERKATLIRTIDRTQTPMGGREIRHWLEKPLRNPDAIDRRLESVGEFYGDTTAHETVVTLLKGVHDIQRLATRIGARKAIPRELHALRESLDRLPELKKVLTTFASPLVAELERVIGTHRDLADRIERAIVPEPPGHLRDGGVIRRGFDDGLDTLIDANEEAKKWIASLEKRERERTGIATLKVGFNKVFGYFIEASNAHRASIPDDYVTKQTLVNSERYYTQALKDKEQVILQSEERRVTCEQKVFEGLCADIEAAMPALQATALAVARVDVLQSLAAAAKQHGFRRPVVDDSLTLDFTRSRHPVIAHMSKEPFVPNDLDLDVNRKQFALITGPNMSGKSTFLRQVALVVILAQMGSFVPAERARVGAIDRVFTRVGAGDRLSRGESTFLVEMKETSYILEHMSDRSLVLLDEVGRGTSTFDGLSIAWAVTEYILQGLKGRPKTLFATHFHELTQLRSSYPRLVNLKITIREWEGGIVFLRKIVPGTSDRSYGIHAAKVAGLPPQVLKRASEILETLEARRDLFHHGVHTDTRQPSLFDAPTPATDQETGVSGDTGRLEGAKEDANGVLRSARVLDGSSQTDAPQLAARIRDFDILNRTPLDAVRFIESLQKDIDS